LTVEDQIKDAEYFLHLLSYKYSRDELRPNLTAFLAISRGVIDHLLEEYNVKFGLNIPLETKLFIDTLKKAAKSQSNQTALDFLKFYKCEFYSLAKTPVGHLILGKRGLMLGKRDAAMHRIPPPLSGHFSVYIQESLNFDEKLVVSKTDKDGKIRQESQSFSPGQNKRKDENDPSSPKIEVKWLSSKRGSRDLPRVSRSDPRFC
jgi:hypothetical protein